jgi:hypothetical protein
MIGRGPNPRGLSSKGAPRFLRKANHSNRRIGAHTGANQTVPYGTALLRLRCPRHFVPGYDRTVPPGLEGEPRRDDMRFDVVLRFDRTSPEARWLQRVS